MMMVSLWWSIGLPVLLVVFRLGPILPKWLDHLRVLGHVPGLRPFLHPHTVLALLMPVLPWFNVGYDYSYERKYSLFKNRKLGSVCSLIPFFPPCRALLLADPDAIKFVTTSAPSRGAFVKPLWMYGPLMLYGRNVGVLEGEQWRRHRRIVTGPAASESVIRSAWDESLRVMQACFDHWHKEGPGGDDGDAEEESVVELMLKMTLFVICGTAFSLRPAWDDDAPAELPPGHRLTLRQALHGVLTLALWKCASPPWLYRFPIKRLHRADLAYREFGSYLLEMIRARREQGASGGGRRDLLAALVEASGGADPDDGGEGRKGEENLSDEEVQGNIYIFLLAGHETTAHTLGFAFALLALYPFVQDRLSSTLPAARPLTYEDFPRLTYATAVFMESLRLHPSVIVIPKFCVRDSVIPLGRRGGAKGEGRERTEVVCPAGTEVLLDAPALHHNPYYWGEDADEFRPERFLDTDTYRWPREAFLGFSSGPRACMGQKFGTVEATAIIAGIVQRYEVLLREDVDGTAPSGEPFAAKRARLTAARNNITLVPDPVPVVFRRRGRAG